MRPPLALFCAILFLLPVPAGSAPADPARVLVLRFESAYRNSKTLRASFLESYLDNGREIRSEAGRAYFGRPGRMRWEYESPERNLFVIDGKWSWFYVPHDHTVTRMRARQSSDWRTPLALLAGEMKVSRFCRRVELASEPPRDPGDAVLKCLLRGEEQGRPREGPSTVLFELKPDSGQLVRLLVSDPGGLAVEFRFANWEFNPPVEPGTFRFEPPKGVAIVDGDLDSEPGRPGGA